MRLLLRLALAVVLTGLLGCRTTAPSGPTAPADALRAQYERAITDAKVAQPSEIDSSLTRIVPTNDALQWRSRATAAGDTIRQVLVVTWTDPAPLPNASGQRAAPGTEQTLQDVVWVTVVPEVQRFCRSLSLRGAPLTTRLQQYIGLPPTGGSTRFVEMWVSPKDLARPCPDPEITDAACTTGDVSAAADADYRQWFRSWREAAYGPDGYPWTRLGYTYDWNPSTDEVGVSEFILRPPASVEVRRSVSTAAYCQ